MAKGSPSPFAHIKDPMIRKQMEELAKLDEAKAEAEAKHEGQPVRFIFAEPAARPRTAGDVVAVLNTFGQREQGSIVRTVIAGELYEVKIYDAAPLLFVHESHRGWEWQ